MRPSVVYSLAVLARVTFSSLTLETPYTEYDAKRYNFENVGNPEIVSWPTALSYPVHDVLQVSNGFQAVIHAEKLSTIRYIQETGQIETSTVIDDISVLDPSRSSFENCFLYSLDEIEAGSFGVLCSDFAVQFYNGQTTLVVTGISGNIVDVDQRNLILYLITDQRELLSVVLAPPAEGQPLVAQNLHTFPEIDSLVKLSTCGPETVSLVVSTERGINYTTITGSTASLQWKWDFGYGLFDWTVDSLSCDASDGYTLYLGSSKGTLHHRIPRDSFSTGLYYRYDGWVEELPTVRNVSDILFNKNVQVVATNYGVSFRLRWDDMAEFEEWRYFSRHRWVVDRENDQRIRKISQLYHDDSLHAVTLFSDYGFSVITADKNGSLEAKSNAINAYVKSDPQWPRMRGLYSDNPITVKADPYSGVPRVNDNDGLWTAMYATGQMFEWLVTGSETARVQLDHALDGIYDLNVVSGQTGFPARSYDYPENDPAQYGGTWHVNPANNLSWKADTSSDEIVGHQLISTLVVQFYPERAEEFAKVQLDMMKYIVDNGYQLMDAYTHERTRWGFWDPDSLLNNPDDYSERLSNSLEILSWLVSANNTCQLHPSICGDDPLFYDKHFNILYNDHNYKRILRNMISYNPLERNFSDDELQLQAMLTFYLGKRDDVSEEVLEVMRDCAMNWDQTAAKDRASLWGFITNIVLERRGHNDDIFVKDLQRMPADQIKYVSENKYRQDTRGAYDINRGNKVENKWAFWKDEISYLLWNTSPYEFRKGGSNQVYPGTCFSYPYWLARWDYAGRPSSPVVPTEGPTTVEPTTQGSGGARPIGVSVYIILCTLACVFSRMS